MIPEQLWLNFELHLWHKISKQPCNQNPTNIIKKKNLTHKFSRLPSSKDSTSSNILNSILRCHFFIPNNKQTNKQTRLSASIELPKQSSQSILHSPTTYLGKTYIGKCFSSARIALFTLTSYLSVKRKGHCHKQKYPHQCATSIQINNKIKDQTNQAPNTR